MENNLNKNPRYLTKGRFKIGSECPRKLYYQFHKDEYANQKNYDEFLRALAEGGHQVGALAQQYFPGGTLVKTLDYEESLKQTSTLLEQENAIVYEGAFLHEDYFIRVDVLVKEGNRVQLIEVKAKSYDNEKGFLTKKGFPYAGVEGYLDDVAFQAWMLRLAHPEWVVEPFLMLVNKEAVATVDGLHQLFRIAKDENGRADVHLTEQLTAEQLGRELLVPVDMSDIVDRVVNGTMRDPAKFEPHQGNPMEERARYLANIYRDDTRAPIELGKKCKQCEFRNSLQTAAKGMKSGFEECWAEKLGAEYDPTTPHIGQLWNFRKVPEMLEQGIWRMADVPESKLSSYHPIQIRLTLSDEDQEWFSPDLKQKLDAWTYPLHFLDFETISPAIPFHKGLKPYESEGFQFSCHHVTEEGTITHDQYINTKPGEFPSYEFLEALRDVLEQDEGTILRYSPHENTILRHIRRNLVGQRPVVPDGVDVDGLIEFIDSITQVGKDGADHRGPRNMVDMYPLVVNDYYHKRMGGKKSLKAALDAVMSTSSVLKGRYSSPLEYGTNLIGMTMFQVDPDTGLTCDPYNLLPPVFTDVDPDTIEFFEEDEKMKNGGAAMTAFAKMQFTEMGDKEREATVEALLRYCELDTLAMVMVWEHWRGSVG